MRTQAFHGGRIHNDLTKNSLNRGINLKGEKSLDKSTSKGVILLNPKYLFKIAFLPQAF